MKKESMRLYKAVKKAADLAATLPNNQVEEDRCLDALKLLKKFPVTYEILMSSQIGKHVKGLREHPKKNIRAFAMELVEIWRGVVIKRYIKNGKGKVDEELPKKTVSAENVKRTPIKARRKLPKKTIVSEANTTKDGKKQVSTKILKRPSSSSHVAQTVNKSTDATRDKIRELLHEALSRVSGEADEAIMDQVKACDPIKVSTAIEFALFQKWGSFNGAQKLRYRSLMFNLKDPKNPDFRRRVLLGEFTPERVVDLGTEDMASDERKKEIENIKMKALFKRCGYGQRPKATTDQFICGRCGKRECTYYQMQTRGADEPMTTYVACVLCNHHWKFY